MRKTDGGTNMPSSFAADRHWMWGERGKKNTRYYLTLHYNVNTFPKKKIVYIFMFLHEKKNFCKIT